MQYRVQSAFWLRGILQEVGAVVTLNPTDARYRKHFLSPVTDEEVVAPAEPEAEEIIEDGDA